MSTITPSGICLTREEQDAFRRLAQPLEDYDPVSEADDFVFTAHLQTLLDEIEGATAHLQIDSLPPPMREAIVRKRDRYEHALRRIIVEGIADGELVDVDPAIVARAALGAMNWTVTWFRPEGPDSAAAVGDVVSRFLVRGVAARTPAARRPFPVVKR